MNGPDAKHEKIERLLKKVQLPEPSEQLKDRITGAARAAWNEPAPDIPWQIPIRRLAISAVAALILISAANHFSNVAIARVLPKTLSVIEGEPLDLNAMLDMPNSLKPRWVRTSYRQSPTDAQGLREHIEAVRRMLEDPLPDEPSGRTPPGSGRSQRLSRPFHSHVCS